MIICGFAGIGKSYIAKSTAGVVDLESTPFNKDWETYSRVAQHMSKNGYVVLVSCHKELRQLLKKKKIKYTVAIPPKTARLEYLARYKKRGDSKAFIDMFETNFSKFIEEIEAEEPQLLLVKNYLSLPPQPSKEQPDV